MNSTFSKEQWIEIAAAIQRGIKFFSPLWCVFVGHADGLFYAASGHDEDDAPRQHAEDQLIVTAWDDEPEWLFHARNVKTREDLALISVPGDGWRELLRSDTLASMGFTLNSVEIEKAAWVEGLYVPRLHPEYLAPRDMTPEDIRAEITRLEGSLARISGEPIRVWDARSGDWRGDKDIPVGGAFVDYRFTDDDSYREWYSSVEAAKAALLLAARKSGGSLDAGGLNLSDGMDRGVLRAWITRR